MSGDVLSGVLPVEKGPGVTSFQVVARVRRLLRAAKVGHGGTLDPPATGVLPILLGEATKLTPYLVDLDKEYVATVQLGVVTDTQDLTGTVIERRPVPELSRAAVAAVLSRFTGVIRQVPPMYSALHHQGRRLHELARAGVSVEREPREVTVRSLLLEGIDLPMLTVRATCGKGTYVRALAADIGEVLGCGAAVAGLVRTRVGPYRLEAAVAWSDLQEARTGQGLRPRILAAETALGAMPEVRLAPGGAARFRHGQPAPGPGTGLVRVYGEDGFFLGVGRAEGGAVRPERLIHADRPGTDRAPR